MGVTETAVATGLVVVAPGPALTISITSALEGGRRAGLLAILGLAGGIVVHALAAAAGLATLVAADARLHRVLQVAGALFLAVVGGRMMLRGLRAVPPSPQGRGRASRRTYVVRGLLTNVLNPWILGFYLAVLPALAGPASGSAFLAAGTVAAVHVMQLALWHGLLVLALSLAAPLYGSRGPSIQVLSGGALMAIAGWFLLR
jgi:threonine/homoserine/homoserine lactone efflux protein